MIIPAVELPGPVAQDVNDLWHGGHLRPLDITGISGFAVDESAEHSLRERYSIAVVEFAALVREARFELGLGSIYEDWFQYDLQNNIQPVPVNDSTTAEPFAELLRTRGMPVEVHAVLNAYARDDPSPAELFVSPHQNMTLSRVLSRWTASQLFDSAIFRLCAALDRLLTALWCAAGLDLPRTKSGAVRYPSFSTEDLKSIRRHDPSFDLTAFLDVARGDTDFGGIFKLAKDARDSLTHGRRWQFAGHGHTAIHFASGTETAGGADQHLAIGLALFDVVRTLTGAANTLMEGRRMPTSAVAVVDDQPFPDGDR